ncbi:MAG: RNA polymerase sigma factor [Candidatus Aminicenantes bacterium]|nr:MAG: RNA polymerase sigma factor [Candidatus Aminicenantes bacterium]
MNPEQFDDLYNEYKNSVYGLACYLTGNRSEAEDLFQETWLRVTENINKISNAKDIKAWIFTIAANLYRDELRKKKVRRMFFFQKAKTLSKQEIVSNDAQWGAESKKMNESNRKDMNRATSQAVAKLPNRQRLVFVLKEVKGYKHREIGEILKMPVGTVKTLLYRATKRLQRELRVSIP